MIPDIDVWRCANVMIKWYGKDAALEAAQRADAMLDKGDCQIWKQIVQEIEEFERSERKAAEPLN